MFERAEIAQRWGGYSNCHADAVPVISAADAIPGFHVATGFSGHGFGIGSAAGRLTADVTGRAPTSTWRRSDSPRFTDGSKVELITGFRLR